MNKRLIFALGLLFSVIAFGVTGFMIIEEFSFVDALYMTVITVTTVGFGEVRPLNDDGKIFTVILCLASIGVVAYSVTVIGSFIFDRQLKTILYGGKLRKMIKMKNHVIICGFGRNGRQAAKELAIHKVPFIIIEKDDNVILEYSDAKLLFIKGDATNDITLNNAGVKSARAIITAFPNDADNVFVVITARSLNSNLTIVSRAGSIMTERKLRVAGADKVVLPERVGGAHMANLVVRTNIFEFLDKLSVHGDSPTTLEEISCFNLPDDLKDKTIFEIGVRRKSGANIIGFKTPEGHYILNPTPDTKVIPNSKLFVLGTPEQIDEMKRIFQSNNFKQ